LLADISATISRFVKLRPDQLLIVAAFVLATWFPDCFEAAPYLWIVGPFGSAKTKLVKLLSCFCRRALIAADVRGGSLYKLVDTWNPTLLIDEFEPGNSGSNAELFRMLRAGSVPGVPTVRNGVQFSTYSLKVIASRQPLADAALASRGIVVPMLPTEIETEVLDETTMQEIEKNFQPRLCALRLNNYARVKSQYVSSAELQSLSPRIKQIARALLAPLLGDVGLTSTLVRILSEHDSDSRIARLLEPEWLVAESLFALCHEGMENGRLVSEILVGGVAAHVNKRLRVQGEDCELTAKKVGLVLSSLGIPASRLGRMGRGLRLTTFVKGKIHEIAGALGINRRNIATSAGLEAGYGGAPCEHCEKFELLGGLHFVEAHRSFRQYRPASRRGSLFPKKDEDEGSPITLPQ
jgi:hypothetical protein